MSTPRCYRLAVSVLAAAVIISTTASIHRTATTTTSDSGGGSRADTTPRVVRLDPPGIYDAAPLGHSHLSVDTETGVVDQSGQVAMWVDSSVVEGDVSTQAGLARANLKQRLVRSAPQPPTLWGW